MKTDIIIKRIHDVIDYQSDSSNFKISFKELTAKYGGEYIALVKAMWQVNDGVLSEEEFMKMNGNMPKNFFDKVINK